MRPLASPSSAGRSSPVRAERSDSRAPYLRRIALEMILTALPIDAARAAELGLVNHVYPASRLREEAQTMAMSIAAHPPRAVRAALAAVRRGLVPTPRGGIAPRTGTRRPPAGQPRQPGSPGGVSREEAPALDWRVTWRHGPVRPRCGTLSPENCPNPLPRAPVPAAGGFEGARRSLPRSSRRHRYPKSTPSGSTSSKTVPRGRWGAASLRGDVARWPDR